MLYRKSGLFYRRILLLITIFYFSMSFHHVARSDCVSTPLPDMKKRSDYVGSYQLWVDRILNKPDAYFYRSISDLATPDLKKEINELAEKVLPTAERTQGVPVAVLANKTLTLRLQYCAKADPDSFLEAGLNLTIIPLIHATAGKNKQVYTNVTRFYITPFGQTRFSFQYLVFGEPLSSGLADEVFTPQEGWHRMRGREGDKPSYIALNLGESAQNFAGKLNVEELLKIAMTLVDNTLKKPVGTHYDIKPDNILISPSNPSVPIQQSEIQVTQIDFSTPVYAGGMTGPTEVKLTDADTPKRRVELAAMAIFKTIQMLSNNLHPESADQKTVTNVFKGVAFKLTSRMKSSQPAEVQEAAEVLRSTFSLLLDLQSGAKQVQIEPGSPVDRLKQKRQQQPPAPSAVPAPEE